MSDQVPNIPKGKKVVKTTDSQGNTEYKVRDDPFYGCYAVTATYGPRSRELASVRRTCKYIFLMNPFMTLGWCVYKFYGPLVAKWAQRSTVGASITRHALANPIVAAASKGPSLAIPALLYLFALSVVAIILFIPVFAVTQIWRITSRGNAG